MESSGAKSAGHGRTRKGGERRLAAARVQEDNIVGPGKIANRLLAKCLHQPVVTNAVDEMVYVNRAS